MIAMRDGVKLYTAIYVPNDTEENHPILINRTPYSCEPYGKKFAPEWAGYHVKYFKEKYIIVFQDVRGRFLSEGEFEDIRPFNPNKKGNEIDESSDTYDTIDWLINNIQHNNGRVGDFGISYPGFYATMAALSRHPALKAVSPQAPVTDWFVGDDFHHKGAFMLMDAFGFYSGFGVPRPLPVRTYNKGFEIKAKDKYHFYLAAGAIASLNKNYLGDSIKFWNELMKHPDLDDWWKARNPMNLDLANLPAMLEVGGLFDAEDCYGAWNLYKAIERKNAAGRYNKIVMGPWFHGAWEGRGEGNFLGNVKFGALTSKYYQDSIEFPFFQFHLKNKGSDNLPEAQIFFSGENKWHSFSQWPPAGIEPTALYLQPMGKAGFEKPTINANDSLSKTSYISDPGNPVPYEGGLITSRTKEYMTADQRFTGKRKDVIRFTTGTLYSSLTLAGPVIADLWVTLSSTDADFVVKLIDVFPPDIAKQTKGPDKVYAKQTAMNNYRMLVRGEIFRGRYRNSFEKPEPFEPGKPAQVKFELPDIAHTFQKGHRLMIEIQSSWFPLADRNPQKFLNIYEAVNSDFQKATITILHNESLSSNIILPILKN
jgi:putative CocE/NonD family hydrolase